jgi:hypothetical protein
MSPELKSSTVTPPPTNGGLRGDQERLIWMLDTIRGTLEGIVQEGGPLFPAEVHKEFLRTWGEVDRSLAAARSRVQVPLIVFRLLLYPRLRRAGMIGAMLELKSASLHRHTHKVTDEIFAKPRKPNWLERAIPFLGPAFKAMNTILGSLMGALPVLELAKEYKDHVELTVETAQRARPDNPPDWLPGTQIQIRTPGAPLS